MEAITAARPYAQAAFQQAQKQGDLKGWSDALTTLAEAVSLADVAAVIAHPRVLPAQLANLMEGLLGAQAKPQQMNFMRVLVENRRLQLLPEILALYESLRAEAEKTLKVTVDSAFELTAEQQQSIISKLKTRMGREIKLECKVNKDLIGGVVIRAGDQVIDGSARTRLGELASALSR